MIHFIRHAQSTYNLGQKLFSETLQEKHGDNYMHTQQYEKEKFDLKYLDAQLTEEGLKQAEQAREKMKDVEVECVIVSPMRRALRTCFIIFADHKSKPAIVVEPIFREMFYSPDDIGSNLMESTKLFPLYDFSHINDKLSWFVHTIKPDNIRNNILKQITPLEGQQRTDKTIQLMIEFQKQLFHHTLNKTMSEEQITMHRMVDEGQQRDLLKEYLKKHNSIAVVSHNRTIRRFSGYILKNCEVYKLEGSKL